MKRTVLPLFLILFFLASCAVGDPAETERSFPSSESETEEAAKPVTESLPALPPAETEPAFVPVFEALPVDAGVFARIRDTSYRDCPLPIEEFSFLRLSYVDLNGEDRMGEMLCNAHIAADLLDIFRTLYEARYPIGRIALIDEYGGNDEMSMRDNNSSCFNYRTVSGSEKISAHGLGLAIDLNPLYNPYVKVREDTVTILPANAVPYADREADFPCKLTEDDFCVALFLAHGFEWGGKWSKVQDYQHFEIPADRIAEWYSDPV